MSLHFPHAPPATAKAQERKLRAAKAYLGDRALMHPQSRLKWVPGPSILVKEPRRVLFVEP